MLAAHLGRQQLALSKIENGEHRPDIIELLMYLEAIGVDPVVFIEQLTVELDLISDTNGKQTNKKGIRS